MLTKDYPCANCLDGKDLCEGCVDIDDCEGANYCRACNCEELEEYEWKQTYEN